MPFGSLGKAFPSLPRHCCCCSVELAERVQHVSDGLRVHLFGFPFGSLGKAFPSLRRHYCCGRVELAERVQHVGVFLRIHLLGFPFSSLGKAFPSLRRHCRCCRVELAERVQHVGDLLRVRLIRVFLHRSHQKLRRLLVDVAGAFVGAQHSEAVDDVRNLSTTKCAAV